MYSIARTSPTSWPMSCSRTRGNHRARRGHCRVEIRKALDKADRIVEKAIDEQLAAEIDREEAAAKESLASED